jgi:ArsR family transcriptional regulator
MLGVRPKPHGRCRHHTGGGGNPLELSRSLVDEWAEPTGRVALGEGGYTCIVTQVRRRRPRTPKQASTRGGPIDDLLDPELFKALCDPTRAKLLGCLAKCARACSVTEVAECCSVDFSVVSRHLQLLERVGILGSSKEGRTVSYAVKYGHLCQKLRGLADALEQCCPADQATECEGGCCGNR